MMPGCAFDSPDLSLFVLSLKYAVTSVAYILEFGIYVFKD